MDVFPPKLKTIWNEWEIRILILISLWIQVFLIRFGSHRKHSSPRWITIPLWLGYLSADWVATVALGVLSSSQGDSDCDKASGNREPNLNNELLAFWAPFLLLHLGGPDSITAFSMEDNELWLRHLLGVVTQVIVAVYVVIRSLGRITNLLPATILMLIAGIIKYSERTRALMLASRENFRDSMVPPPNPGPNYARFMEEYYWKTNVGANAKIVWDNEALSGAQPRETSSSSSVYTNQNQQQQQQPHEHGLQIIDVPILLKAHKFFEIFKRLIVDLILTFQDRNQSQSYFRNQSWERTYTVIEIELVYVYEVLYTKAAVIYTLPGLIFHICSIICVLVAFMTFVLFVEKHPYLKTDVILSYVLLVGAIILELWSLIRLVFSDWTIVWLNRKKKEWNRLSDFLMKGNSRLRSKAWSNSMAQYNLISFCLSDQPTHFLKLLKLIHYKDVYDKYLHRTYIPVTDELKKFIFDDLKSRLQDTDGTNESYKRFGNARGKWALQKLQMTNYDKEIDRSIEVEFDESILQWHIATDICYYLDTEEDCEEFSFWKKVSRDVSNYMIYLLISRPFMLTAGIGQIRYVDTCAEAEKFFQQKKLEKGRACKKLFHVHTEIPPKQVKGDASKSVLFDSSRLAKSLQKLDKKKRWELMSHIWVEMLYYAASNCRGNYHAQRLSSGGELLTVVWFLMAHLGIGEQYRVEAGNARAKYSLET